VDLVLHVDVGAWGVQKETYFMDVGMPLKK
jgi:hypothetical protein